MTGLKALWPLLLLLGAGVGCSGDQQEADDPVEVEESEEQDSTAEADAEETDASADEQDAAAVAADDSSEELDASAVGSGLEALKSLPKETAAVNAPQELKPTGEFMWVNVGRATVRSAANKQAQKVSVLKYGEKVEVLGRENGYVIIGEGRYVLRSQLTDRKERYVKKNKLRYVRAPDLNVRSAPRDDAQIVGRVTRGEAVVAEETLKNGWVKIGEGQYVNGRFLSKDRKETLAH